MVSKRQGPGIAQGEQAFDKIFLLQMGLHGKLHHGAQAVKKGRIIALAAVPEARQIDRHILQRAEAHFPGRLGILDIACIELEAQAAALGYLCRLAAVENKIGGAFFACHIADMMQEILPAFGAEKLFSNMHQRLGEEKRPARAVAFLVHVKQRPDKPLRLFFILAVGLARKLAARPDGGHIFKMLGHFPVQVDVGKNRLTAPRHGLLREFIDQHLRKLFHLAVAAAFKIGGKKEVHGIPADGAGKMALQRCGKFYHMRQQHFRLPGGLGNGQRIGQAQAETLYIFKGLARAVGPVDEAEVVQVNVAAHVRIAHIGGKHLQQGIFLFNAFGKGQIGGLGAVRNIGVFLIGMQDHLIHIIERHAQAGMFFAGVFKSAFDKLGINQLADKWRGDEFDAGLEDNLLNFKADPLGDISGHISLANHGINDFLPVPARRLSLDVLTNRARSVVSCNIRRRLPLF